MKLLHWLTVIGIATLKMIPALGLSLGYGMRPWEIFATEAIGGLLSVFFFTFFGMQIRQWRKDRRKRLGISKPLNYRKAKTWKRRWTRFGLPGIAIIVPPFLSPMLAALISVYFERSRLRILLWLGLSVIAWAGIFSFLGHQILDLIHPA